MSSREAGAALAMLASILLATPSLVAAGDAEPGLDAIQGMIDAGAFAEAAGAARERLAGMEAAGKGSSNEAARTLNLLVEALWRGGEARAPGTLSLAREALRIAESAESSDPVEVAAGLRNLGIVLETAGDLGEAEIHYERALALRAKHLGEDDILYALSLQDLADVHASTGRYDPAIAMYEKALRIQESAAGEGRKDFARTLNNLARALRLRGEHARAMAVYERAIAIKKEIFGPGHPEVAWTLNSLAVLLEETGDLEQARVLYEESLRIRRNASPLNRTQVAWSLDNLAALLIQTGDLAGARRNLEESLAIQIQEMGEAHHELAVTYINLARLSSRIGDPAESERLYAKALELQRGTTDPLAVGATQEELAGVLLARGDLEAAESLYREAIRTMSRVAEAGDDPHLARAFRGIGETRLDRGDLPGAMGEYLRALAIYERAYESPHPERALALARLGDLQRKAGALEPALESYRQALGIQESVLGARHPAVGTTLEALAGLLLERGETEAALEASLRAETIGTDHLRLTFRALSEREALRYAAVRSRGMDAALSVAAGGGPPGSVARVWSALIGSRAMVLDEMARRNQAEGTTGGGQVGPTREALIRASRRLANLILLGPREQPPERYRAVVETARREMEAAERGLADQAGAERDPAARERVGIESVRSHLPPEAALVAFASYARPAPPLSSSPALEPERRYLALLLPHDGGAPEAWDIGDEREIDALIEAWRGIDDRSGDRAASSDRQEAGLRLRERIWDPIRARLGRGGPPEMVLLVPDGALHQVNFYALPEARGAYVIEGSPLLHYLDAERDVVALAAGGNARRQGDGLLAMGGPDFGAPSGERRPTQAAEPAADPAAGSAARSGPICRELMDHRFEDLPDARKEAAEVAALWGAMAGHAEPAGPAIYHLEGAGATEEAFKRLAGGRHTLHLASHAFALGDRCVARAPAMRGARAVGGVAAGRLDGDRFEAPDSPLLYSGIALAGANLRGGPAEGIEDGILTAQEISALDLSTVRWAVLSACDTGAGAFRHGEGILGLRRAFTIAGAGTVIVSLWAVGDEATREWMNEMYRARLTRSLGAAEAVRQASLARLRALRDAGRVGHPAEWAGFIAAGDWR